MKEDTPAQMPCPNCDHIISSTDFNENKVIFDCPRCGWRGVDRL